MLHLFWTVISLIKRRGVNSLVLPVTYNVIAFVAKPMARAFTVVRTTDGVGFLAHLIASYLWFDFK